MSRRFFVRVRTHQRWEYVADKEGYILSPMVNRAMIFDRLEYALFSLTLLPKAQTKSARRLEVRELTSGKFPRRSGDGILALGGSWKSVGSLCAKCRGVLV